MAVTSRAFGDLTLAFTDQFTWSWDDEDSRGKYWVSFWHPTAPEGFHALGTVAIPAWGSANLNPKTGAEKIEDHVVALCVKETGKPAAGQKPALARPAGYEKIWTDVGTGSKYKGSIWRPLAPEGYVAMGCVVPKDTYDKPPLDAVMCVREDLTFGASAKQVYTDKGTGGKIDLSVWSNIVPPSYVDNTDGATRVLIAANTFTAHAAYDQPFHLPDMHVLCVPMPVEKPALGSYPQLVDRARPAEKTPDVAANALWVPFTAFTDTAKSVPWKLANSPFYKVQRKTSWTLLEHLSNDMAVERRISKTTNTGIEKTSQDTFNAKTGISVSSTAGISLDPFNASVTTTFSLELGYERMTSLKEFESSSTTWELSALPNTSSAAWIGSNSIQVTRADGSPVSAPLTYVAGSIHYSQYPNGAKATK
ncbi:Vps62-related protein [Streptomyces sp. NPDC048045]|uniref:Vps62-related protein n=1 Tax=Streptomyces sp. NPDC048045 TaxID=3154710 RepID=UPI00341F43EC